jgi:hypothetical protein
MVWERNRILVMESYAGVVWIPWRGWLERVEATGWVCECVVGQLVQAGSAWMLLTGGTEAGCLETAHAQQHQVCGMGGKEGCTVTWS